MAISSEFFKEVKRIQIRTTHMVNDLMAGQYESVFKGQGMEFEEVREYQPGDDVRNIDWNVTARMGRPFVKRFVEERELTVMLLVDLSGSGAFGTERRFKNEVAAELCALLAYSAIKNNDRVGLIIFTDTVEKFVPPKKGRMHILRVVREVLGFEPRGRGTNIGLALEYLGRIAARKSVVFLVSDFLDARQFDRPMKVVSRKHDLIAVAVDDPRERELPQLGLLELEDAETGRKMVIDTRDRSLLRGFRAAFAEQRDRLKAFLRSVEVDAIEISTDRSYVEPIVRFFKMREKRLQVGHR